MFLLSTIRNAIGSWRKRVASRGRQRTTVALEQLDHRRLLAVNFTGNALADIPDTTAPGTAIVLSNTTIPINNPQLAQLIKVSGFDISAIRMKYTPDDDTLSVAIQQPSNQRGQGNLLPLAPVIAGDADNNGDGGTVSLAVRQIQPLFQDFGNLGGSETMAVFLDFNNDNLPDVVAGVPNTPGAGKFFTVANAVPNPGAPTTSAPTFGTPLQANTGFAFLRDTEPTAGAFEFQITNFAKLYQSKTGMPLTASTIMKVGGFAGSPDDFIDEEYVPAQPVNFGLAPPPIVCPPLSPSIFINPHHNRHINTAHPGLVRVNVVGSSGFLPPRIVPESVMLSGAKPVAHFATNLNRDEFPDATYVFRADQIQLAPGTQLATFSGLYVYDDIGSTTPFSSSQLVFVRGANSYSAAAQASQAQRQEARGVAPDFPPAFLQQRARSRGVDLIVDPAANAAKVQAAKVRIATAKPQAAWSAEGRTKVSIPTSATAAARQAGHKVSTVASAPRAATAVTRPVRVATPAPVSHATLVDHAMAATTVANPAAAKVSSQAIDQLARSLSL